MAAMALAQFAGRLCTDYVDLEGIRTYVSCRLIPLNKNAGVRRIWVGNILRRIVGKVFMSVGGDDVLTASGTLQICAGHEAGDKAAVHAMSTFVQEDVTEASDTGRCDKRI